MNTHPPGVLPSEPATSGYDHARRAVSRVLDAAASGGPGARSLLLIGARDWLDGLGAGDLARRLAADAVTVVEVRCGNPTFEAFQPLQQLLEEVVEAAGDEIHSVLRRYAPEVASVHPELAERLELAPAATSLVQVALTPSERRSHRESEQAFRIVTAVTRIVLDAQRECQSLRGRPLMLHWRGLEGADRPTLMVFRRLEAWVHEAGCPVVVVGELEPPPFPPPARSAAHADVEWRAVHGKLLGRIEHDFRGQVVRAPRRHGPIGRAITAAAPPVASRPGAVKSALNALHAGQLEEGCVGALFAIRQAVFAVNFEAVLMLGAAVLHALARGPATPLDASRLAAAHDRLAAQEPGAALEFTLAPPTSARDVLIATWKAVGMVHSFLERHEIAMRCYGRARSLADDPVIQAQIEMYLGLIAGKRLHQIEAAESHIQSGIALAQSSDQEAAVLERGWLLNAGALMAFQTGRHRTAMAMVREAFTIVRPIASSEATHLKINLLSNISVLLEATGHAERALDVWLRFAQFLDGANDVFLKHYCFREGGLRMKCGDLAGALRAYETSYAAASEIDDDYHQEVAARACAYISFATGDHGRAGRWYGRCAELLDAVGLFGDLPDVMLARAVCEQYTGDAASAARLLELAGERAQQLGASSHPARELAARTHLDGHGEWRAHAERAAIRPPSTKLNRPFPMMSVVG